MASLDNIDCRDNVLNKCSACSTGTSNLILPCLHVLCQTCFVKDPLQNLPEFHSCPLCGFNVHSTNVEIIKKLVDRPDVGSSECNNHIMGCDGADIHHPHNQDNEQTQYCHDCACVFNESNEHNNHKCSTAHSVILTKKEYIKSLVAKIEDKRRDQMDKLHQLRILRNTLQSTVNDLRNKIELRAQTLCTMVNKRKYDLLNELQELHSEQYKIFSDAENCIKQENAAKGDSLRMTNALIANNDYQMRENELQITDMVANRIIALAEEKDSSLATRNEFFGFKLNTPDLSKERFHLEKLYGSLAKGTVHVGHARILKSFSVDLAWLTGLSITKSKVLIVIGKTGALESEGKVIFVNSSGTVLSTYSYDHACVPWCIINGGSWDADTVLVSDSGGCIKKFSSDGNVIETWKDCFRTGGQMAVLGDLILVSSTEHCIVNMLDRSGQNVLSLGLDSNVGCDAGLECSAGSDTIPARMTADFIALDGTASIVIYDSRRKEISLFNASSGVFMRKFLLTTDNNTDCASVTGICCDSFGNLLVSDFTKDCIHIFSLHGQYLGQLLGKDKGISCPTCIHIDTEGHIFVGQYGGEVTILSYVSFTKHL